MSDPAKPFPAAVDGGPFAVEAHDALPSTNARARDRARAGATDLAVIADAQTAGRGRLDREWASPSGGIWVSVVVRPDLSINRVPLLTFAAAVAVVEAVRIVDVEAVIKWPNDVLVAVDGAERKLAGILTESAAADGSLAWAVIGIGLNANIDEGALPPGSTSLSQLVGTVDRVAITEALLAAFAHLREDPAAIRRGWRQSTSTLGRRVRIETDDGPLEGRAIDIDAIGRLLVDTGGGSGSEGGAEGEGEGGVVRVAAGDCQHLRPAG